jgi:hypothetical protein
MTVHVVLFRPRASLTVEERGRLASVFSDAVRAIPSLRRVQVGTRVTLARAYEAAMRTHYSHAAILEFDDVAGLREYLEHPAHDMLGRLFFEMFEEALIYDFQTIEGAEGVAALVNPEA